MQQKRVGEYQITSEVLGRGSFSTVYLGYNSKQEKLAVKIISRQKIKQFEMKYCEREVAILRKCKNEHIVNLIDIQKSKSNCYIFLEYCQGGSVAQYIKSNKRLPQHEALRLFSQLIKGMSFIKEMNIMHRDLKPANLMLKNGNVKIVDFGLARKFQYGQFLKGSVGSPLNMAPQILKQQKYTDKADIYSAGTILYEMLYGVCPYQASNREQLIKAIERGELQKFQEIPVSEHIKKLLKLMLQPNPLNRINLIGLHEWIHKYDEEQEEIKKEIYKKKINVNYSYFSIFGGIVSPFLLLGYYFIKNDHTPYNLDLRMCCKLIEEIKC